MKGSYSPGVNWTRRGPGDARSEVEFLGERTKATAKLSIDESGLITKRSSVSVRLGGTEQTFYVGDEPYISYAKADLPGYVAFGGTMTKQGTHYVCPHAFRWEVGDISPGETEDLSVAPPASGDRNGRASEVSGNGPEQTVNETVQKRIDHK